MKPGDIFGLFKDTFKDWSEDKATRLGASLAYYTIFSIGPVLLITVAIASFVFADAKQQIVTTVSAVVGKEGGDVISSTIDNANKGGANVIATIIGIITLLLAASGVFGQLKDSLNTIWEVKLKPDQGILATLKDRFLSFTMVLGTGFLLLVSLVVNAGVAALNIFLKSILPGGDVVGQIVSLVVTFGIITVMFALLFRFLPDVDIRWKDVWIGAAITALLFGLASIYLPSICNSVMSVQRSALPARWWSCWSGYTTQPRYSCSGPNSRRFTRTSTAHVSALMPMQSS